MSVYRERDGELIEELKNVLFYDTYELKLDK